MTTSSTSLDDLRRRIDEIDDQLHDLVMQRAEVVEAIAGAKKQGRVPVVRPGREALILRRLVERHRGHFPRTVLVRLWRELISGTVAMQGDFAVAVFVTEDTPGYWDLARDHYGSHAPLIALRSVGEVLRALAESRAAAGVLPMPADGESEPWWHLLAASGASAPRVMARLPFAARGNARGDDGDVLVVGYTPPDPTGADRSLIVIEAHRELSRARLISAIQGAGLSITFFTAHEPDVDVAWNLVEIDDLVAADDGRLVRALEPLGDRVLRVVSVGAYARPFAAAALEKGGEA
ncbi:MAG TPA: chorismate mutase [Stellaceae bacterium]|nr:chorismate mutase [Stellaceae bacterium]